MPRDNGEGRKKVKAIKGGKAQLAALKELKKVTAEIEKRFKVSEKLFIKKDKLKRKLGIDL